MTVPVCVLVGPPGSGKTTVGQLLADQLGVAFRDTDRDIEASRGTTIADIFLYEGEDEFRRYERDAVGIALHEHAGVLALGGGAVIDPATRQLLVGHRVVLLTLGLTAAAKRVGFARDRPVLAASPRALLARLLDERRPLYDEVATVTIETDAVTPQEVVALVVAALGLQVPTR